MSAVDRPRIALIGAGPVGSLLAMALLSNGVPFQWVVRNPARREQLDRLRVSVAGSERFYNLAGVTLVKGVGVLNAGELDWLILAVKAHQVEAALAAQPSFSPQRTLVVANGIHVGPFCLGVLHGGACLDHSGLLVTGKHSSLRAGALDLPSQPGEQLAGLAAHLNCPHLSAVADSQIACAMWRKAALNCAVNPLTALLDCRNDALLPLLDSPLVHGVLREIAAVIAAEGCCPQAPEPAQLLGELRALVELTAANSSSMREDLRAGRETEIEHLNLAVVRAGERHGLPCPLNAALARMVSSIANRGAL